MDVSALSLHSGRPELKESGKAGDKRPGRGLCPQRGRAFQPRDVVFTPDDKRMLVSVGSASNDGEGMGPASGRTGKQWGPSARPPGERPAYETDRAAVLAFDSDGQRNKKVFRDRHPELFVGLAVTAAERHALVSTNERGTVLATIGDGTM